MIKEWNISIAKRGGHEKMVLWSKRDGMYKGYGMSGINSEDRKSLAALIGWASLEYRVQARDIKIEDSLFDRLID